MKASMENVEARTVSNSASGAEALDTRRKERERMTNLPQGRGVSRRAQWIIGLGVGAAALLAWSSLRRLIGQMIFALLLSALALPLCRRMERTLSRAWAAAGAVAALILLLLGGAGLLLPQLISQISFVIAEAPRMLARLQELWDGIAEREWIKMLGLDGEGPGAWMTGAASWISENLPMLLSGIGSGIDALSRAFLAPVLAYYFLRDREVFCYRLSLWIPLRCRRQALAAIQEMRREAGGYVRGQMLVAAAVAMLTALGLLLVGVPAWLALGLLMGVCEWIPYVGPLIGGVPIALFSLPQGLTVTLWSLGVTIFVQQIEGYFLSPRLMAGATNLHPVYVLLLLSAGGLLAGLPGMVAAVPLFVCLRGAVRVLYETKL